MLMKHIKYILLSVVNGILMTVEIVKRTPLWLKEQAEQETEHQWVQLLIMIDGPLYPLLLVEAIFGYSDGFLLFQLDWFASSQAFVVHWLRVYLQQILPANMSLFLSFGFNIISLLYWVAQFQTKSLIWQQSLILLLDLLAFKDHVLVGAVIRIISLFISSSLLQDIIVTKSRCFILHGLLQHPRIAQRILIGMTLVQHQTARLTLQLKGNTIISNMGVWLAIFMCLV